MYSSVLCIPLNMNNKLSLCSQWAGHDCVHVHDSLTQRVLTLYFINTLFVLKYQQQKIIRLPSTNIIHGVLAFQFPRAVNADYKPPGYINWPVVLSCSSWHCWGQPRVQGQGQWMTLHLHCFVESSAAWLDKNRIVQLWYGYDDVIKL